MTLIAIPVALATILYCLQVRRSTWTSRWEADVTACITLQGVGVALMSPWAAHALSARLQGVFGIWNLQALAGHLCMVAAAGAMVHHILTRLCDGAYLRQLFTRWVLRPLTVGVPTLVALFAVADQGFSEEFLSAPAERAWQHIYWLVLIGLAGHLLWCSVRLLLIARADTRSQRTVDWYLLGLVLDLTGCGIQLVTTWQHRDTALAVWLCLCTAAICFALGAARSWQAKLAWFGVGSRPTARR